MKHQHMALCLNLRSAFILAATLICIIQSAAVQASENDARPSLRYALTSIVMGEDQKPTGILVPVAVRRSGKNLKERIESVFRQMVSASPNRYGTGSLAFKQSKKSSLEVYVWLDATKPQHHPLVIAETVYTFTEMGVDKVQFPKFKIKPLTRRDIGYPSFSLSVPSWRAVDLRSPHILTVVSGGAQISTESFVQRLESGDKDALKTVWSDFEQSNAAALSILRAAHQLKLADRAPRCLSSIESAKAEIRIAAVNCLVNVASTEKILDALLQTLKDDPEESVRRHALKMMENSADIQVKTAALIHGLSSPDAQIVLKRIEGLQWHRGDRVGNALARLLTHKDDAIQSGAQSALVKRADNIRLTKALGRKEISIERKRSIAAAMLTSKLAGEDATAFLATSGSSAEWFVLAKFVTDLPKAKRLEFFGAALTNPDASMRMKAVQLLRKESGKETIQLIVNTESKDPKVSDALGVQLMALCDRLTTKQLFKDTRSSNLKLKGCALSALSRKSRNDEKLKERLLPILNKLAKDANAGIRAAAIGGLGQLTDPNSLTTIKRALTDKSNRVLASVATALGHFKTAEAEVLLKSMSSHQDPTVIVALSRAFVSGNYDSGISIIAGFSQHSDLRVKMETTSAVIALLSKGKQSDGAFSFLNDRREDENVEVRLLSLDGFKVLKNPRRIDALELSINDTEQLVQLRAIEVLGSTKSESAVEALAAGLAAESLEVRKAAITALQKLGGPAALDALRQHREREDDASLIKLIDSKLK